MDATSTKKRRNGRSSALGNYSVELMEITVEIIAEFFGAEERKTAANPARRPAICSGSGRMLGEYGQSSAGEYRGATRRGIFSESML